MRPLGYISVITISTLISACAHTPGETTRAKADDDRDLDRTAQQQEQQPCNTLVGAPSADPSRQSSLAVTDCDAIAIERAGRTSINNTMQGPSDMLLNDIQAPVRRQIGL